MEEIFFQHIHQYENNIDPIFTYKNTTVYLSNYLETTQLSTLQEKNICYIINATRHFKNHFTNNIKYLKIFIRDADIYTKKLYIDLPKIYRFFEDAVNTNTNILIHCKRGHRRSATIVAILMKKYNNIDVDDSINLIKSIRPNSFKPATTINNILNYI